jgi:hemoglobin
MLRLVQSLSFACLVLLAAPARAQDAPPPFPGDAMFQAFNGQAGVDRVVDSFVRRSLADPRLAPALTGADVEGLRQVLKSQLCYLLGGGCGYAPPSADLVRDQRAFAEADFGAFVSHLQAAMTEEGVPPRSQNRLIARLAPLQ